MFFGKEWPQSEGSRHTHPLIKSTPESQTVESVHRSDHRVAFDQNVNRWRESSPERREGDACDVECPVHWHHVSTMWAPCGESERDGTRTGHRKLSHQSHHPTARSSVCTGAAHAGCTCRVHMQGAHAGCTCRVHMQGAHAGCTVLTLDIGVTRADALACVDRHTRCPRRGA